MSDQVIIVLGREHGSLGHEIAEELSEKFGIKLYDKKLLNDLAEKYDMDEDFVSKYDEKPMNPILDHLTSGMVMPLEHALAEKVFRYERALAKSGESFVVVGRCADYVLQDNPNVVSVFICGEPETKIKHLMEEKGLDYDAAKKEMNTVDKHRMAYHNTYAHTKWDETSSYGVMLNSSKLGKDKCVEMIIKYVELQQTGK